MTADDFRRLALGMDGAVERSHMNHPDFRVKERIFASLGYPDDSWGMVSLTPAQQKSFLKEAPKIFTPCAGAWGKAGATSVHLASAKKRILAKALKAASQNIISPTKS